MIKPYSDHLDNRYCTVTSGFDVVPPLDASEVKSPLLGLGSLSEANDKSRGLSQHCLCVTDMRSGA